MNKLLIIILVLFSSFAFGQEHWMRHLGSTANDEILSMAYSGNKLYSAGYFSGTMAFNQDFHFTNGLNDCFVFKGDNLASAEWSTTFGGPFNDRASQIALSPNNSIAVCGFFNSIADFGPFQLNASNQSQDGFIASIDPNGNFNWALAIGGDGDDIANSISVDSDGNILATGFFKGTMNLDGETYTSAINPNTNEHSADIYIIKLSSAGDIIWFKHGIGTGEDSGLSITVDNSNNVYCGLQAEFEISFGTTYPSNVEFSGFILKFDPSGNELWLLRFSGFQTMLRDLKIDSENNLIICGDYTGILNIDGADQLEVASNLDYKAFLLKCSSAGQIDWVNLEESENLISANKICLDQQNNPYVTGTFRCQFTSLSNIYGEAIFYSLGYRDIYVSKIDALSGNREWSRNIASSKDDYPGGIQCKSEDLVYLAGSFSGQLMAASNNLFWIPELIQNVSADFSLVYDTHPNYQMSLFCEDEYYTHYHTTPSFGNKDMFIGLCIDLHREPLDWILHTPGTECSKDLLYPEFLEEDELDGCLTAFVSINTHNTAATFLSPDYQMSVNGNPLNNPYFTTQQEMMYYLVYERLDGCYSSTDSIMVNIHPRPEAGHITDSKGVNFESYQSELENIVVCLGDTTILTGGNINGNQVEWSPATEEQYLNDSTIYVTSSGNYNLNLYNEFGCVRTTVVNVIMLPEYLEYNATPELFLYDGFVPIQNGDTIRVCQFESVDIILLNTENEPPTIISGGFTQANITGASNSVSGTACTFVDSCHYAEIYYNESTESIFDFIYNPSNPLGCEIGPFSDTLHYEIYIEVIESTYPYPFQSELLLCPGSSLDLDIGFPTDSIFWDGPGIQGPVDQNQVNIVLPGEYFVSYWTTLNECSSGSIGSFDVVLKENFTINSSIEPPAICPNQDLILTANEALSYLWIGPLGTSIGSEQSILVTEPGPYYCQVQDLDFCNVQSEIIEIYEYFQPYADGNQSLNLCSEDELIVELTFAPNTSIQWQSPLSGSNAEQIISQPGNYSVLLESCGITTTIAFEITDVLPIAEISILSEAPFCPGDSVILQSNTSNLSNSWSTGAENTNEIIVSQSGSYGLTVTDEFGCSSLESTIEISIEIPESPSIMNQEACLGGDLTLSPESEWDIFWYSNETLEELLASSDEFTIQEILVPQSLYLTAGSENCQSEAIEVQISIDPSSLTPEPLILEPYYCNETSVTIDPQTGLNYTWQLPDQSIEIGSTLQIPEINPSYAGEYSFYAFSENCTSLPQNFELFVPALQSIEIEPLGEQLICEGDSLMLSAISSISEIHWTPDLIISDFIFASTPGEYSAYVEDEYGCQYFSQPSILNFIEVPNFTEVNQTVCLGETLTLNISGEGLANWYNSSLDLLDVSNQFILGPIESSSLIYCSQINSEGCIGDTVPISIYVPFENGIGNIIGDQFACEGADVVFSLDEEAESYLWSTPSGNVLAGSFFEIQSVSEIHQGDYQVTAFIADCEAESEIHPFDIYDVPNQLLTSSPDCYNEQVILQSENGLILNWSTEETSDEIIAYNIGWYSAEFITENNCLVQDSIFISHLNCSESFPNIFSPNDDGFNDEIIFSTFKFEIERVLIFNRWGAKVLEITRPPFVWKGDGLSEGTYFYLVEGSDQYGNRKQISSSCMLVR